ncbi:MAG: hypothetical protein RRC34_03060 [Lentisphaeria bacterium]|nr:hypothetical protein [Lentisphaeria bacterium]
MNSIDQNGPNDMNDDELRFKLEDFQAETQMKVVIPTAIVLFIQCCLVLVVAVVTLVSPEEPPDFTPVSSETSARSNEPRIFETLLPATGDTYVSGGARSRNFGADETMELVNDGARVAKPLIGFSLPDLTNHTLKEAELVLTPLDGWEATSPSLKIVSCSGAWNEKTVTMDHHPAFGGLMGFIPKGEGYDGKRLRIPLDIHALLADGFSGVWVETLDKTKGTRFMTKESGKGAPELLIKVEGLAPLPETGTPVAVPPPDKTPAPPAADNPPAPPARPVPPADTASPAAPQVVQGQWTQLLSEDFERPDVQGYSEGKLPENGNWVGASRGYGCGKRGITDKSDGGFSAPGNNDQAFAFRYTNSGIASARRAIGPLTAHASYRVSFDVVMDGSNDGRRYAMELVAHDDGENYGYLDGDRPGVVLVTQAGTASADGVFSTVSVTFTPDADKHAELVGRDLSVRFLGATTSANIDNVKVEILHPKRDRTP